MANSSDIYVARQKEMLSTATFNAAIEQAYNASSWGKYNCLLGIGNITLDNSTDFTITDVVVALPDDVFINNTDGSSQNLKGIEVTIATIVDTLAIGETKTITVNFNIFNDTDDMYQGSSQYDNGVDPVISYDYYIRGTGVSAKKSYIEYTTGVGVIGVDILQLKNINGVDFEVTPIESSTATLPLYTKVQNSERYENVSELTPDTIAPVSLVTSLTDNIEWLVNCTYTSTTSVDIGFNQLGKAGNGIPTIPLDLTGLTVSTDYHIFIQYKYINNVISDLTAQYYTTTDGNTSLPTNYVQQRVFSFKSKSNGDVPLFLQANTQVTLLEAEELFLDKETTTTTTFSIPAIPLYLNLTLYLENVIEHRDITCTQFSTNIPLLTSSSYYTENSSLDIQNNNTGGGAGRVYYYLSNYIDLTSSIFLKGLY